MTVVLGIGNPIHDTGAAAVEDGSVVAAVNESRLSRVKRESRFPSSSVNAVLDLISGPVDEIALSGVVSPYAARNVRKELRHLDSVRDGLDRVIVEAYGSLSRERDAKREAARQLRSDTALEGDVDALVDRLTYVDHHRAHAASAYYTSGFDTATVLTVDAAGDGYSATVYRGDGGLDRIAAVDDIDSVGKLWAQIPTVFGFKGAKHAGKFMGMASYAEEVPSDLRTELREILFVDGLAIRNHFERDHRTQTYEDRVEALRERLGEYDAAAVARALQDRTEAVLTEFAIAAVEETGDPNVALAGGVFANVKVNQRIYELDAVDRLFVHQHMGDGGIGLGAALDVWARRDPDSGPTLLDDVFLGPSYGTDAVERAIKRVGLPASFTVERFDEIDGLAAKVADILVEGNVVSLYTGRVEYGPRALGNRSILYQPTDPTAIEWLNERLDRTEFMPFAPVTLKERATECYVDYDSGRCPAADFMTISFDCTETMADRSPGVVHVDGTARPQLIEEDVHPLYYRILAAYEERTGIPSLINTSFNMHGEPIVCKPMEAIKSFMQTGNEALVLNDILVRRDGA